ncbi:delta-lactam-biosynthetic de-N-acetylase [Bacillus mangrovi]|uniref:Delta-lactam-biosynthetic de-N-acetylase n=1 Tax=Metabacillus mangrovi TaxID=1491830 RepID=A0A7X2S7V6_9BACI|nr:delta-lactam-biosynthetic de-N-acetylase [Metabacillus mangrovi]MTH54878.1 delta-lactam-biosynthetic de-N-acetylase [Metabacillus mangrovi]
MRKPILGVICVFLLLMPAAAQAVSNAPINWGFAKSRNHVPAQAGRERYELLAKYGSFYLGDTEKKDIYLTFDNGYEAGYTPKVLDVLKKQHVPATFFVTGHYLEDQPDLVQRMANDGHIVGNHSWFHPDLTAVGDARLRAELDNVSKRVKKLTGQDAHYLRPPRGVFSERVLSLANEYGYQTVFWSLAFVDWHTDAQKGWRYSYDNIMKQIHPGAILLLHTVSKDNADALDKVIMDLKKEGYRFRSLDDLMVERSELPL